MPGRRCPPARPCSPRRPAPRSRRSPSGGPRDGRYRIEPHGEFTVPSSDRGRHPARHPAHRGRPPGDDRRRPGAVVQLQAHVARRSRRVAGARGPCPGRVGDPWRHGGGRVAVTGTTATEQPVPAGESAPAPVAAPRAGRPRLARHGRARRSSPGCPRPRWSRPPSPRASCGTGSRPPAATRRARTSPACARASPPPTAAAPPSGARPPTRTPSSASCEPPSATRPATTSRSPGPGRTTSRPRWRGWTSTTRTGSARRSSTAGRSSSSACTTAPSSCRS